MVDVPLHSAVIDKSIVDIGIPHHKVLIIAIERNEEVIIPRGSTTLRPGDKISVMANDDELADFVEVIWNENPKIKEKNYFSEVIAKLPH